MSWAAQRRAMERVTLCASPAQLAALLAIAGHLDGEFRGCFAGQETLAGEALMSVRSFQRQLAELREAKLIEPGDPSLVEHIRWDRRPDVWDFGEALRGDPTGRQNVVSSTPERGDNLSTNGATKCRTNLKSKEEPKNLRASDVASAPSRTVDAFHRHVPPSAGQATESSRSKPAKLKKPTLDQRLDAHLAALGPGAVLEVYDEFVVRSEGLIEHWIPKVRAEQGYPEDSEPNEDEFGDEFARKVVVAAILTARKPNKGGLGEKAQEVVRGFDWEPWRRKKPTAIPDDQSAPASPQKPPRWRSDQEGLRAEEMRRIEGVVWYLDTSGFLALEEAVAELDGAAYEFGRRGVAERHSDVVGEQARRLSLVYALSIRPLSSWPQRILPWEIRADSSLAA